MANQTEEQSVASIDTADSQSARLPARQGALTLPVKNDIVVLSFEELYAKLNPEQKAAVDTIEGPVMVLAGPGTGKTQILTLRIANILQQTQMKPSNILAITFTESAAANMRERLVSIVGPEAGYGVHINTFHGLANSIITESGINFYPTQKLEQIDEVTRYELVIRAINKLGNPKLRPPGQPEKYIGDVARMLSDLKREEVSPEKLRELVNTEIESIRSDEKHYRSGDLMVKWQQKIDQYERTLALADAYEAYQKELAEQGWYDFDDMMLFVIRAFQEDEGLKLKYQEQFQYILVDEYQDTNNSQNELVRLLTENPMGDSPNIFVVGDDKQSIYRFQGASVANLYQFLTWYPAATVINLRTNYRSFQKLLDAADTLIQHNKSQLGSTALSSPIENVSVSDRGSSQRGDSRSGLHPVGNDNMVKGTLPSALKAHIDIPGEITIESYANPDAEVLAVAEQIQELVRQGTQLSEIAILYRRNSDAEAYIDLFSRIGLPFLEDRNDQILAKPDVRRLRTLLEVAFNPKLPLTEQALFFYLHMDVNNIPADDLLKLCLARRMRKTTLYKLLTDAVLDELELENPEAVRTCRERIKSWYQKQYNASLGETVEYILNDSGLLAQIMASENRVERLEDIRTFYNSIKDIGKFTRYPTLEKLLDKLSIRERYGLGIGSGGHEESKAQAVRLLTAHRAKGLEFDIVFIVGANEKGWGRQKRREAIVLPPGIVPTSKIEVDEVDEEEEERRLFFVAMTRARKKLVVTHTLCDGLGREVSPSPFVAEIRELCQVREGQAEKLNVTAFFTSPVATTRQTTRDTLLAEQIREYALAPTSLNTYLQCPQLFLYQNIYQIPAVRSGSQAYGEAIHRALEYIGRSVRDSGEVPEWNTVANVFNKTLAGQGLNETDEQTYRERGERVLQAYLETEVPAWQKPLDLEYNFRPHQVMLDGTTPITGKLDKIEPIPGSRFVRVIDYKTGSIRSRNAILGKTAEADEDYWRQLLFYQVLASCDSSFPYQVGEVALVFLDNSAKFKTEVFTVEKPDLEQMKELIRHVRNSMLNQEFDHTPHKKKGYDDDDPNLCDRLTELHHN